MAAKPPKAFDVWFVKANTVYKAVPYNVVADWVQQGRLAGTDMVRPSGTEEAWTQIAKDDLLSDYLPRPTKAKATPAKEETSPAGEKVVGKVATPFGNVLITERANKPTQTEGAAATAAAAPTDAPVELPDPEPPPAASRFEEDDEVDMIPLIDISMVLLVFFIMIQAAGALAPVDVPEMKYAGELREDPDAITITIEKFFDATVVGNERIEYSVRVGPTAPRPSHDKLPTPEAAIKALHEALAGATRPPEVRIACRKDLPRERVYELRRELEPLQKRGVINSTVATVVEAPNK